MVNDVENSLNVDQEPFHRLVCIWNKMILASPKFYETSHKKIISQNGLFYQKSTKEAIPVPQETGSGFISMTSQKELYYSQLLYKFVPSADR